MYYFNSRDEFFKKPFGAVKQGCPISFKVYGNGENTPPVLCIKKDGGEENYFPLSSFRDQNSDAYFEVNYTFRQVGLYFYKFILPNSDYSIFNDGKGQSLFAKEGVWFTQTVYEKDFTTPNRFKNGVFYQIFPDRFYESRPKEKLAYPDRIYIRDKSATPFYKYGNGETQPITKDYYGGDLKGICDKIGYLKNLGVKYLYLNPIFESHENHRYNTADYMKIDPDLGTTEDFINLCKTAHENGILIVLDGVFSHTGSDSLYFNKEKRYGDGGAFNNPNSPYRSWYVFDDRYKNGYRSWWDFPALPEVNEHDPSYIDFICGEKGVIKHWLGLGADGFRLDVADELPDEFIEKIRQTVKSRGQDKLLIGEVWEDAVTKESYGKRRTYLLGKGLDGTMNYPFRAAILDFIKYGNGFKFCESIYSIYERYPKEAMDVAWNMISTHDTVRGSTEIAGDDVANHDRAWQAQHFIPNDKLQTASKLLMCAYALAFTLPGVPCVYYGDEICTQGYKDPFNRSFFDWSKTDCQTVGEIREMANFRNNHSQYAGGKIFFVFLNDNAAAFVRFDENGEVLTAVNRGIEPVEFNYKNRLYKIEKQSYILEEVKDGE